CGEWRHVEEPPARGQVDGARVGPGAPRVEYRLCLLYWPEQCSGVDLGDGIEFELECGHDPKGATAAAESPEEVGLVVVVGAHETAVRRDEFDCEDAVCGEVVTAGKPADAAPKRVADDADVGCGARERGEPEFGGGGA